MANENVKRGDRVVCVRNSWDRYGQKVLVVADSDEIGVFQGRVIYEGGVVGDVATFHLPTMAVDRIERASDATR